MNYGERLKRLREDRKLSQQQLADRLNINRSTYARYELGQTQPDYETLQRLADFYEVSVDYLFGRENNNNLPELTAKDKKDIAKQLERILEAMDSDTGLAFDGEPMDEETKELVKTAIKSNLELTKQLAKQKFTPKKYRKDKE
jgi:transcriptional regulator with XRE-family HTH domain